MVQQLCRNRAVKKFLHFKKKKEQKQKKQKNKKKKDRKKETSQNITSLSREFK